MLKSLPKHLHRAEMEEWHHDIAIEAGKLRDEKPVDDDIHQLRKYNKDLMYVTNYIPAPVNSKQIAEVTGSFMDNSVLLDILTERKHDLPRKELEMLDEAGKNWQSQKDSRLREVKEVLHRESS